MSAKRGKLSAQRVVESWEIEEGREKQKRSSACFLLAVGCLPASLLCLSASVSVSVYVGWAPSSQLIGRQKDRKEEEERKHLTLQNMQIGRMKKTEGHEGGKVFGIKAAYTADSAHTQEESPFQARNDIIHRMVCSAVPVHEGFSSASPFSLPFIP